jgi:maltose alpha-D-glucosyltransferase/alpha-amylase
MYPSIRAKVLCNHDELDLGRLEAAQRELVFSAFGPMPEMQLYGRGIRRRLAPMLQGDRRRIELAYSLMLTLPGTPVVRYGDEIGMGDDLKLPERNCARTQMQWSTEPQAGFTKAANPILPVISECAYAYQHVNVAAQRYDPNSLLNWMERMIRIRKEVPEIGWGDFSFLSTRMPEALAMRYEWRNNSVVCVHNLSSEPKEVRFKMNEDGEKDCALVNLLSDNHSHPEVDERHDPSAADWRRFGRLPGFTNCKPKYRKPDGHFPFVRLKSHSGQQYRMAGAFVDSAFD